MNTLYISTGSNMGNRKLYLKKAKKLIQKYFHIHSCSDVYETEPIHFKKQNNFLNQIIKAQTNLNIITSFQIIQNIETSIGRKKTFKYGPRNIDIDLLLFNNETFKNKNIIVPHPAMTQRRFILEPLYQINKNLTIPPDNKHILDYLNKVKKQNVSIYNKQN